MKTVSRDYTLSVQVPDDVKPDDVEVIIHSWSASYTNKSGVSIEVDEGDSSMTFDDPYEEE